MKRLKFHSSILIGTCFFALMSCGSNDSSSSDVTLQKVEQQDDQGVYRAVLRPLNSSVAGNVSGTVEIRIEGDEVIVESHVAGSPSGIKHFQNIMSKTACPTIEQDSNNDTYVDMNEALPKTGPILIPLDSDLSEQFHGMDFGPIANSSGSYIYRRSTGLSKLMADLQAIDPDPVDHIIKLPFGHKLNLSGRVIMVHGVGARAELPETVKTLGDLSVEEALPIACGKLVRVTNEDEVGTVAEPESSRNPRETTTTRTTNSTSNEAPSDEVEVGTSSSETATEGTVEEEAPVVEMPGVISGASFMATSDLTPGTFI